MGERERRKKKKIIIGSISAVVFLLLILYFGMAMYFRNHFIFRTEINGWKVGGMTAAQVEEKIGDHVEDYLLTVFDRDGGKHHVYGRDIGCKYVPDGTVEKLLKEQNPLGWVVSIFKQKEETTTLTMEYKEDLIEATVKDMSCFMDENITEPQNVQILLGEDGYYVEPEVMGNRMIYDRVLEKIKEAVAEGKESVTLTDEDYENPEYTKESSQITEAMANIEKYADMNITYQVPGGEEVIDAEQIQKFVQIGEDFQVELNEKEIEKYVQSLASKYNTYADVRAFHTSSGDTVNIGGGDYGWIVNKTKEAEQLKADLEAGASVNREPIYSQRAFVEGADDIGNTYIEIDYTKQHLWFYKEGALVVESDIVSGNISLNNGSPDGVFKIVYKDSPAVLKGEDYQSNVTYFMPFAYNVGIHDASWRKGEFGGEIYKTSGSHGCINVPLEVAQTIYENAKVGTPVIAFYREPVELTAENCKISNAYSYKEPEEQPETTP